MPEGTFLTGPIHLRSGVNLHVAEGATLQFSQDLRAYLRGYPDDPICDIRLVDCRLREVKKEDIVEHVEGLVREEVFVNGTRAG